MKPYVKRGKTDAADAAAICEAVTRPSMRFVAIKSEACSSVLVLHRTRDFLVRQRTQIGNAIRAHMTEFGIIAAKGAQNVDGLKEQVERLPEVARMPVSLLFAQLAETNERIERLTNEIAEIHAQSETSQRLATIPGVGMLSATIIAARHLMSASSTARGTMLPGSALHPNRTPPAVNRGSAESRRWAIDISDDCCIWAPWLRS